MTSRAWFITYNNYTVEGIAALDACECRYIAYAAETAPTTGTPHIHAYIYFDKPVRRMGVKKALGAAGNSDIEQAKGTCEQALAYIFKETGAEVKERGERPAPGKRTDIQRAKQMLVDGATIHEVAVEIDSYQAVRHAQLIKATEPLRPRDTPPRVIWIHGPTGSGKTRTAHAMCPLSETWVSNDTLEWFDGYDGQPNVIIDDFRASDCKYSTFLRILDRYPLRLRVKGGFTQWRPTLIVITSTHHPREVYMSETIRESINQLLRRIHEIIETAPTI